MAKIATVIAVGWLSSLPAMVSMVTMVTPAYAANEGYCRNYASAAISQSRTARDHDRCRYLVRENPARWTLDYGAHFGWCRGQDVRDIAHERTARAQELNACIRERSHRF